MLVVSTFLMFIPIATAADGWSLVYDGRGMKAYPDLKEYVWQKNASAPPHTAYDKIGLHRLVKTGITSKAAVFICPEQSSSGEEYVSNPPSDNTTKYESQSQAIYWANRDFDVYVMDFRWNFVPNDLDITQLSFMAEWSRDTWMSDMKEAINKVKEVSGVSKVFIVGYSGGGASAVNYAAKYWQDDARGIILLSPWAPSSLPTVLAKRGNETNTYNLTKQINTMFSAGNWSTENLPLWITLTLKYALENPSGPAVNQSSGQPVLPPTNPTTGKTWTNVTEYFAFVFNMLGFSNVYGGYGNLTLLMQHYAYKPIGDRWVPARFALEDAAMMDWVNCPYLPYDFDDHYEDINVPVLAFVGSFSQNSTGTFRFVNGIGSSDLTGVMLKNYGHYDIFFGPYAVRDVSQPALNWMNGELTGFKATAFCDVTVLPGWTWNFFAHSVGGIGTHTYQWYEDTTPIQGQTSMILSITKNTPGVYTYYCKVTDSEGTTTNSNIVTLTVR
jgi:pimeloyl-ACP methyl ester carboxylesterase